MTAFVNDHHFFGATNLFGKDQSGLTHLIRSLARYQARQSFSGLSPASLTDNSTGVGDRTMGFVSAPAAASLVGSDCVAKSDAEAALGTVVAAMASIVGRLETMRAKVPVADTPFVNNLGSASTTIAAITKTATGSSASLVSASGFASVVAQLAAVQQQTVYWINLYAAATGVDPRNPGFGLLGTASSTSGFGQTFAAISTGTGSVGTGTNDVVKVAAFTATMTALANNVADLVLVLNDATTAVAVPLVVAQ